MDVNATLDGNTVVIIDITLSHYKALVTYIDTQSGAGNAKVVEIPLIDLSIGDQTIATSAQHN